MGKSRDAKAHDKGKRSKGMAKSGKSGKPAAAPLMSELLRLPEGPVDLGLLSTRATPGFSGDRAEGATALAALGPPMETAQEKLFAHGAEGGPHRVLLVLQGMDTSGKGGVMRHVVSLCDPQGVRHHAFKKPTKDELAHDFLWRIRQHLPRAGEIGVFDRSHYEDVLVARVHKLAPTGTLSRRYGTINRFEERLVESGCTVIKCMLHVSPEEQKKRLLDRLEDPTKYWKYNPKDVDERYHWDAYREAYEIALERTNTPHAPWYVVPADRKWFRNLAIGMLLREHLDRLDLSWPLADFDVAAELERVRNA